MEPNTEKTKKHAPSRIRWDKIKVTFVSANKQNPNPMNPYISLSFEERKREILYLSAKIWKNL